jgi:hypothetical protein
MYHRGAMAAASSISVAGKRAEESIPAEMACFEGHVALCGVGATEGLKNGHTSVIVSAVNYFGVNGRQIP